MEKKPRSLVVSGLTLWGKAKITWTHIAVYVNGLTFLLMTSTWYKVAGQEIMDHYLGFVIPYYIFLLILVGAIAAFGILVEWRISMPSVFRAQQDLLYTSSKIFRKDIEKIINGTQQMQNDYDEMKGQMEDLLKKIEDLEKSKYGD